MVAWAMAVVHAVDGEVIYYCIPMKSFSQLAADSFYILDSFTPG